MNHRQIKVLFLTRYPIEGASSRYRVYQYLDHLRALGVDASVQSFMDTRMYAISFVHGRTPAKLWETAKAVVRRLNAVLGCRGYDIIYMQRELLPFGPPLPERWLKRRGAVLLFDYDDALFIGKPSRYNPLATLLRAPGKVLELFRIVDCVVAGNDWLRDQALAQGARRAVTIEVAEDVSRFPERPAYASDRPVTIGWLGSSSTVKYLRLIEPVLQDISRRCPEVRFELMGGGEFHMEGVPWQHSTWSLAGECEALQRFDIGLMPLPQEDWARGKSGGKARTYMAASVVPVCTAIGYNLELIEHERTGMLCNDLEDWREALLKLVQDAQLRYRIATEARREVEQRFSPKGQARLLHSLFQEAVAGTVPAPRH